MAIQIDDKFLDEVGLSDLPPAEKSRLIDQIFKTLEMRVGTILADQMNEQQLDEFDALMDEAGGVPNPQDPAAAKALKWLEGNFPHYRQVVAQEHDKLKAEIKRDASKILEASRGDPGNPA